MTTEEDGPSADYVLAHYALRQIALSEPLQMLAILASPDANRFIDNVMQDVAEQCGKPNTFDSDSVRIHPTRVNDYPCAIIEFPEPEEIAEAHLVAVVGLIDMSAQEPPDDSAELNARYFTLEKGMSLNDEPRTVLAEWNSETHSNYGDGPPATAADFAAAIAGLL